MFYKAVGINTMMRGVVMVICHNECGIFILTIKNAVIPCYPSYLEDLTNLLADDSIKIHRCGQAILMLFCILCFCNENYIWIKKNRIERRMAYDGS